MSRKAIPIDLSQDEGSRLEQWATSGQTSKQVALRCRLILAAAAGRKDVEIAIAENVNRHTVRLWRQRVRASGIAAVRDIGAGRGRKPKYDTVKQNAITEAILQLGSQRPRRWTCRSMATTHEVSKNTVWRLWRRLCSLTPHLRNTLHAASAERQPDQKVRRRCIEYLRSLRWPEPNGFECRQCGSWGHWPPDDLMARCEKCGKQNSLVQGTAFENSRVAIETWFSIVGEIVTRNEWLSGTGEMVKKNEWLSARCIHRRKLVGSYATACSILNALRKMMGEVHRPRLHGTVRLDVVPLRYLARTKDTGDRWESPLVIIAVQHSRGRAVRIAVQPTSLARLDDYDLHSFCRERLAPDAVLETRPVHHRLALRSDASQRMDIEGDENWSLPICDDIATKLTHWLMHVHRRPITVAQVGPYLSELEFRFNECLLDKGKALAFRKLIVAALHRPISHGAVPSSLGQRVKDGFSRRPRSG